MAKDSVTILVVIAVCFGSVFVPGCQNDAQVGSAVGVLAGASIGQVAGGNTESTLLGAVIGGGAGYVLGNESDKAKAQAERDQIRNQMKYVAVNITNSNGSVSQVRLKRHGVGYVGTRGEYYDRLPTQDQLLPIYGF